jgi:AcrR family transcriptional regulator
MRSRRGGRPEAAETARLGGAILAAAEAAFLKFGFSKASIQAIAAAAGTSKQTVFARFGSKERLFIEVSNALLRERFSAEPSRGAPVRDKLIEVAAQALDAMLDPKMVMMFSIIMGEAKRFPELARLADEDSTFPGRERMLAIIAEAAAAGEVRCTDPRRAMLMLQDMVLSSPLRAAIAGADDMPADARRNWVTDAVDIFMDGLRSSN